MLKKLKNYFIRNFSQTTKNERIIKIYNKGKKKYFINCVIIITISNIIIFYTGLNSMKINLLQLAGVDNLYVFLFILIMLFINMNILFPVIGDWNSIENKYKEVIKSKTLADSNLDNKN